MAKETKRRKRVKTTSDKTPRRSSGRVTKPGSSAAGRYTQPTPQAYRHSSRWVPVLMLTFFFLGVLIIILDYLPGSPLLPAWDPNYYLLLALGFFCLGFAVASRWR